MQAPLHPRQISSDHLHIVGTASGSARAPTEARAALVGPFCSASTRPCALAQAPYPSHIPFQSSVRRHHEKFGEHGQVSFGRSASHSPRSGRRSQSAGFTDSDILSDRVLVGNQCTSYVHHHSSHSSSFQARATQVEPSCSDPLPPSSRTVHSILLSSPTQLIKATPRSIHYRSSVVRSSSDADSGGGRRSCSRPFSSHAFVGCHHSPRVDFSSRRNLPP